MFGSRSKLSKPCLIINLFTISLTSHTRAGAKSKEIRKIRFFSGRYVTSRMNRLPELRSNLQPWQFVLNCCFQTSTRNPFLDARFVAKLSRHYSLQHSGKGLGNSARHENLALAVCPRSIAPYQTFSISRPAPTRIPNPPWPLAPQNS